MSSNNSLSSISTQTFLTSLDATDLKAIEDEFYMQGLDVPVDKPTFGAMLSQALSKGNRVDYYQLFDMVDISREGLIDWDRFSNYLLLEYYEREDRIKTTQVPQWQDIKNITIPHKNSICCILQSGGTANRYCCVSKDGLVSVLNDRYEIKRVCQINTNPEEIRSKDLWITGAAYMQNVSKIAFATTSREIWIYDMATNGDFVCQFKILGMKFIPLCINYWSNKNNNNTAILTFGDTGGFVYVIFFKNATSSLFDKPWKSEQSQDACFQVNIENIVHNKYPSASCLEYKAHSAWVRQIMFIPLLDCFLTCSTTSTDSIVLAWLGKSRSDVRLNEFKIPLGINGFDYQESLNLIASAGINNHVCLWNPYVVSKPVGVLRGHMQVIVAVQFIRNKHQLISLSKDKVLRIWDVNLQICVQRLTGIFPKGPDTSVLMHYDQETNALFAAFNYHLQVLKMKREVKHRVISHDSPITEAIYNEKYGHVISVDESSCITIWFLNTGQKVKHITEAHGEAEITTVCLDHSQTRILTAGTDGAIKIWDINGNCHHILVVEDGNPCEISQILYLKRMILAIGWSKVLCYFSSTQLKSYYVYPTDWKGKQEHFDDILAADFSEPRTLVTASYDGDIVFWNTNTQNSIRKVTTDNHSKSRRSNRLPPLPTSLKASRRQSEPRASIHSSANTLQVRPGTPLRGKRHSISSTLSTIEDSASFVTITSISYLKQRNANTPLTADLYSCHSDGKIRFWNSLTCEQLGHFAAFDQFGSLVSCTNSTNELLCVGNDYGSCKIWFIDDYLHDKKRDISSPPAELSDLSQPKYLTTVSTHTDSVTAVQFIERNNKVLLLTASTDCAVAIHSLNGLIGIFGQNEHWNVNDIPTLSIASWMNNLERVVKERIDKRLSIADEEAKASRAASRVTVSENTEEQKLSVTKEEFWDEPEIQEVVNQINLAKSKNQNTIRARNVFDKKGNCSYRSLTTTQMDEVEELEKPEFVLHPERYFLERDDKDKLNILQAVDIKDPFTDQLKLKHDEKSIFPKYILDMDIKMRTAHKLMVNKQGSTRSSVHGRGGRLPRRQTVLARSVHSDSQGGVD